MSEADEQIAAMRAAMDQFREVAKELAGVMAGYRQALVDAGVSEADALQMTIAYQGTIVVLAMQWQQTQDGQQQ